MTHINDSCYFLARLLPNLTLKAEGSRFSNINSWDCLQHNYLHQFHRISVTHHQSHTIIGSTQHQLHTIRSTPSSIPPYLHSAYIIYFIIRQPKMAVTNFCAQPSVRFAKERIKNPPSLPNKKGQFVPTYYEHHVGSWAFTMLNSVFHGPEWIITPEMIDTNSKKKARYCGGKNELYRHRVKLSFVCGVEV